MRARLAHRGLAVGGTRVLRLMRAHGLLAPRRLGPPNEDPAHAGTIITDRPDVMWGTDATRFYTEQDGWCWFFGAIDHHLDELVGWMQNATFSAWYNLYREGLKCDFQARGTLCTTRRKMRLTGLVDPSSVERSQIPGPWRTM